MADLSLKISADFNSAQQAFEKLAKDAESAGMTVKQFTKAFEDKAIDQFEAKQKLAAAAISATKGDLAAAESQYRAYGAEIQRLIKNGMDPESDAVQKLRAEYTQIGTKIEAAKEAEVALAAASKAAAEVLEKEADIVVKQLDAKGNLAKENVKLKQSQDDLKEKIKEASKEYGSESDQVKELQVEYEALNKKIEQNEKVQDMANNAAKAAATALAGIGAATGAFIGLALKGAASVEDMTMQFKSLVGGTEQAKNLVKELNKEAVNTPFELDAISKSVKTLLPAMKGDADAAVEAFKMLGDTAGGSGQVLESVTSAYSKAMLKGKVSMQELNQIANAGVPIFDEMAKSMGVTVAKLMNMSSEGELTADHLTGAFARMTGEGGVFFEGMKNQAFTFSSSLLGVKENLNLTAAVIGEKFLPYAKEIVDRAGEVLARFNDWISEGNNLESTLKTVGIALVGAGAALAAFLVITKGAEAIRNMTAAFKAFNLVLKDNPLIAITAGVIALITAFSILAEKVGGVKEAFAVVGKTIMTVIGQPIDWVLEKVQGLLEFVSKFPGADKLLKGPMEALDKARAWSTSFGSVWEDGLDAFTKPYAEARKKELDDLKSEIENSAKNINLTPPEMKIDTEADKTAADRLKKQKEHDKLLKDLALSDLKDRLAAIAETEAQGEAARQAAFAGFLSARLEAEKLDDEARITYLQEQAALTIQNMQTQFDAERALILKNTQITEDEKAALEQQLAEQHDTEMLSILQASHDLQIQELDRLVQADKEAKKKQIEEEKKVAEARRAINQASLSAASSFFGDMAGLLSQFSKENKAALAVEKVLGLAQIAMNTAIGISQAIAQFGPPPSPLGIIGIASAAATGVMATASLIAGWAKAASAETGGSFIANGPPGVDTNLLRVNNGEQVDVTPAGQVAQRDSGYSGNAGYTVDSMREMICEIVNWGFRRGLIYAIPTGNI
ncbi:hypothetical protein FACS1894110_16600 [Spirochaetia bacterium]|nr:hypothetical protein FACS1894110_16600 [Spirochaetia bacterium]